MMLVLKGVSVEKNGARILSNINLAVRSGSFFTLMGPTGCGKTSLLRIAALLDRPSSGSVLCSGRIVPGRGADRLAARRRIAMLFQRPVLFKGTVRSNIAWGLRIRHMNRDEIGTRIDTVLDMVGMQGFGSRHADTLSGGELQRTALARALALQPELLILDEPTVSLDPAFRHGLRERLSELHERTGTTFMIATHDFEDALSMGSEGALMQEGRIVERGSISDIFYRPSNRFTAEFVGIENIIPVRIDGFMAKIGELEIVHVSEKSDGRFLAIPAESIVLSTGENLTSERNRFRGRITATGRTGVSVKVSILSSGVTFVARVTEEALGELSLDIGSEVYISWKASAVHVF